MHLARNREISAMAKQVQPIEYFDRRSGRICRENVMGDAAMRWAYESLSGRIVAPLLFASSLPSRLLGLYFDSALSRRRISGTIRDLQIDASEFAGPVEQFTSFNDFFTRRLREDARPYSEDERHLLSPADGRLLVYDRIDAESCIAVKGVEDSLSNLFGRSMADFSGGQVAVVRLCPADYHWFHFPCDGRIIEQTRIKGRYDSVNPLALNARKKIFCRNKREYCLMDTPGFGRLACMEVGAFGVAGIHQRFAGPKVRRMQPKGYFDFGGSTVVLVFQKDTVRFDNDLMENSRRGIETLVRVGETIGSRS